MSCPKCNKGRFFERHPYNFKKLGTVKKKCNNCGLKYNLAPGFFQDSYSAPYGLGVALFVIVFVLKMQIFKELPRISTLILRGVTLLVLAPLFFAFSKIIWMHLFVNYNKSFLKEKNCTKLHKKALKTSFLFLVKEGA